EVCGEPMAVLKEWLRPYRSPRVNGAPPFTGGCVGFLSYDIARSFERIPELAKDDLLLPDYEFMLVDRLWMLDLQEQALYCAAYTRVDQTVDLRELCAGMEAEARSMAEQWEYWYEAAERDPAATERRSRYQTVSKEDGL